MMNSVVIDDAQYRQALLQTIDDLRLRSWTATSVTCADLGRVFAQLPGEEDFQAVGDYVPALIGRSQELLSGWLEYLRSYGDNPKTQREAEDHVAIIGELKASKDVGWIIVKHMQNQPGEFIVADGRHRLFAMLDFARRHSDLEQPVFREK